MRDAQLSCSDQFSGLEMLKQQMREEQQNDRLQYVLLLSSLLLRKRKNEGYEMSCVSDRVDHV